MSGTPSFTLTVTAPSHLQLTGTLNVYTACDLRDALADQIVPGSSVAIDLAGVTACDLTGLQLLHAAKQTAGEDSVRFAAISPAIGEACSVVGLDVQTFGGTR